MKKKYLVIPLSICFALGFSAKAFAEELPLDDNTETPIVEESQTIDEPIISEEPIVSEELPIEPTETTKDIVDETSSLTWEERWSNFMDEWRQPIISAFTGMTGAVGIIGACFTFIRKMKKEQKEAIDLSNEERNEQAKKLIDARTLENEAMEQFKQEAENLKALIKEMSTQMKEMMTSYAKDLTGMKEINLEQVALINQMKELIVLLVSSNPDLQNNGYAQKFIELVSNASTNDFIDKAIDTLTEHIEKAVSENE